MLVKDGEIVGEGFHPRAGEPHADAVPPYFGAPSSGGTDVYYWYAAELPAYVTGVITFTVVVANTFPAPDTITNSVVITSSTFDPEMTYNEDLALTSVEPP